MADPSISGGPITSSFNAQPAADADHAAAAKAVADADAEAEAAAKAAPAAALDAAAEKEKDKPDQYEKIVETHLRDMTVDKLDNLLATQMDMNIKRDDLIDVSKALKSLSEIYPVVNSLVILDALMKLYTFMKDRGVDQLSESLFDEFIEKTYGKDKNRRVDIGVSDLLLVRDGAWSSKIGQVKDKLAALKEWARSDGTLAKKFNRKRALYFKELLQDGRATYNEVQKGLEVTQDQIQIMQDAVKDIQTAVTQAKFLYDEKGFEKFITTLRGDLTASGIDKEDIDEILGEEKGTSPDDEVVSAADILYKQSAKETVVQIINSHKAYYDMIQKIFDKNEFMKNFKTVIEASYSKNVKTAFENFKNSIDAVNKAAVKAKEEADAAAKTAADAAAKTAADAADKAATDAKAAAAAKVAADAKEKVDAVTAAAAAAADPTAAATVDGIDIKSMPPEIAKAIEVFKNELIKVHDTVVTEIKKIKTFSGGAGEGAPKGFRLLDILIAHILKEVKKSQVKAGGSAKEEFLREMEESARKKLEQRAVDGPSGKNKAIQLLLDAEEGEDAEKNDEAKMPVMLEEKADENPVLHIDTTAPSQITEQPSPLQSASVPDSPQVVTVISPQPEEDPKKQETEVRILIESLVQQLGGTVTITNGTISPTFLDGHPHKDTVSELLQNTNNGTTVDELNRIVQTLNQLLKVRVNIYLNSKVNATDKAATIKQNLENFVNNGAEIVNIDNFNINNTTVTHNSKTYGPFTKIGHLLKDFDISQDIEAIKRDNQRPQHYIYTGYGFSGAGKSVLLTSKEDNSIINQIVKGFGKEYTLKMRVYDLYGRIRTGGEDMCIQSIKDDVEERKQFISQKTREQACKGVTNPIISRKLYYFKYNPNLLAIELFKELPSDLPSKHVIWTNNDEKPQNGIQKIIDDINNLRQQDFNLGLKSVEKKHTGFQKSQEKHIHWTPNNDHSSRSHLIIDFEIMRDTRTIGEITMIDMAGSEDVNGVIHAFYVKTPEGEEKGIKKYTYDCYTKPLAILDNRTTTPLVPSLTKKCTAEEIIPKICPIRDVGYDIKYQLDRLKYYTQKLQGKTPVPVSPTIISDLCELNKASYSPEEQYIPANSKDLTIDNLIENIIKPEYDKYLTIFFVCRLDFDPNEVFIQDQSEEDKIKRQGFKDTLQFANEIVHPTMTGGAETPPQAPKPEPKPDAKAAPADPVTQAKQDNQAIADAVAAWRTVQKNYAAREKAFFDFIAFMKANYSSIVGAKEAFKSTYNEDWLKEFTTFQTNTSTSLKGTLTKLKNLLEADKVTPPDSKKEWTEKLDNAILIDKDGDTPDKPEKSLISLYDEFVNLVVNTYKGAKGTAEAEAAKKEANKTVVQFKDGRAQDQANPPTQKEKEDEDKKINERVTAIEQVRKDYEDGNGIKKQLEARTKALTAVLKLVQDNFKLRMNPAFTNSGSYNVFSKLLNEYMKESNDSSKKADAANNLAARLEAQKLLPEKVLAITKADKVTFVFLILFFRLIVSSIVETLIMRGKIKTMTAAVIAFLGIYTLLFVGFCMVVNLDMYRLRIIFNYVNFHAHAPNAFLHLALIWVFGLMIYMILWNLNFPFPNIKVKAISDVERMDLITRLTTLTMILWAVVILVVVFA